MNQKVGFTYNLSERWAAAPVEDLPDTSLDDSLTNLDWLVNMKVFNLWNPQTSSPPPKAEFGTASYTRVVSNRITPTTNGYTSSIKDKPPYSYASLIKMAINASEESKLTVSDIYSWITENFNYYKRTDSSWRNSIRHSLSVSKCFKKIPRGLGENGRGSFWTIHPDFKNKIQIRAPVKRTVDEYSLSPDSPSFKRTRMDSTVDPA